MPEKSFILKHDSCTAILKSANNGIQIGCGRTTCQKYRYRNVTTLVNFGFFLLFNHINYINQTRFLYVHVYNTLICISKLYIFLYFILLLLLFCVLLIIQFFFGFKKNHCCLRHKIQYMLCSFFWGEGVSLILSLVMLRLLVVFSYIIRLSFVFVILYKLMVLEYVFCKALFKWLYTVHNSFINSNNTVTEWLRFVLD